LVCDQEKVSLNLQSLTFLCASAKYHRLPQERNQPQN
jgi:hypothetical protein